jgi:hypothetical protein
MLVNVVITVLLVDVAVLLLGFPGADSREALEDGGSSSRKKMVGGLGMCAASLAIVGAFFFEPVGASASVYWTVLLPALYGLHMLAFWFSPLYRNAILKNGKVFAVVELLLVVCLVWCF